MTRTKVKEGGKYFGPYTDTKSARTVLDLCKELFQLRSCRHAITREYLDKGKGRLCLDYHLHRCGGPCKALVSPEEYGKQIEQVRQILRGDTAMLMELLHTEMERLSAEWRFEEAQELKEQYDAITRYRAKSVIVSQTMDEVDVFGIDDDGKEVFINYMHVRHGAVVRSVTLEFHRRLEETAAELLSLAMAQISAELETSYREVITSITPDVVPEEVRITRPQRGDKAKLLEVSVKNARQYRIDMLKNLEHTNPEARTERLLERMKADFRLTELPRHIECFDNSNIQEQTRWRRAWCFATANRSKAITVISTSRPWGS